MANVRSTALLLFFPAIAACNAAAETPDLVQDPVTACVERGVTYFESIGSYPALKEPPNVGRAAKDVALERCRRTVTAL